MWPAPQVLLTWGGTPAVAMQQILLDLYHFQSPFFQMYEMVVWEMESK